MTQLMFVIIVFVIIIRNILITPVLRQLPGTGVPPSHTTSLCPFQPSKPPCKRLWCWEGLGAGGEGDDREWDGWMASPTQWTWVSVDSGSWWWTGRPGVLRFMDMTERLNWTELKALWLTGKSRSPFPPFKRCRQSIPQSTKTRKGP